MEKIQNREDPAEPRKGESRAEYMARRMKDFSVEKLAKARADLAERIRRYEKNKNSMGAPEQKFNEAMIEEDKKSLERLEFFYKDAQKPDLIDDIRRRG